MTEIVTHCNTNCTETELTASPLSGTRHRSLPNPLLLIAVDVMASPFADPDVLFGLELKEPWASMVLDGSKTIETRTYDLPAELIDRPLVLLATPEHSGSAGHSGLADVVTDRGAATILGLVTFGGVVEWESREAWSRDREKHGVPDDDDGPYVWREDDAAKPGTSSLRGWTVSEVIPLPTPVQSPPMRRVLRSIFALETTVEELLAGAYGDDEAGDDGLGRWDDEGENDRPWH